MTRSEFTRKMAQLILIMIKDKHIPIEDYVMRSKVEQFFLFSLGRSKCDGFTRISRHQAGLAKDIYFVINRRICFDYNRSPLAKRLAVKYHKLWVEMGGRPMIQWDKGHYAA